MLVVGDFNRRIQPGNDLEPDLGAVRVFCNDRQFFSGEKIRCNSRDLVGFGSVSGQGIRGCRRV